MSLYTPTMRHPDPVDQSAAAIAASADTLVEILAANSARRSAFVQNLGADSALLYKSQDGSGNPFCVIAKDSGTSTGDGGKFEIENWTGPVWAKSVNQALAVLVHEV